MKDITVYVNLYILSKKYHISDNTAAHLIKDFTGHLPSHRFRLADFFNDRGYRPKARYILQEMRDQGYSQVEMSELLNIKQPTVNYHLALLKTEKEHKKNFQYTNYYLRALQNEEIRIN